ncbi:MAG: recombinase family protein [Armatimonadota bacterium]
MNIIQTNGSLMDLPHIKNQYKRVAIYARKSSKTEDKEERSKSREEQVEFCRVIAQQMGFDPNLVEVYMEEEGMKGNFYWEDPEGRNPPPFRPVLTQLLSAIVSGTVNVVIVWRSDRLIRNMGVADAMIEFYKRYPFQLICAHREYDLRTSGDTFAYGIEACNNERWKSQTSEDVKRNADSLVSMGLFSRNPSCYGFRSKGPGTHAAEPVWDELDMVNRIFRLFCIGEGERGPMGVTGIAKLLMEEGISLAVGARNHKCKTPERIHTSQISTILKNCMYVGRWRHRREEFAFDRLLVSRTPDENRETAVPVGLFESAQEKLRLLANPSKRSHYSNHMLTGIVVCAYCGKPLQVHYEAQPKDRKGNPTWTPRRWFFCNNTRPPKYCKPYGFKQVQEQVVDDWVMDELGPLLAESLRATKAAAGKDADIQKLASLQRQMEDIQRKETQKLLSLADVLDKEQFAGMAQGLRVERERLTRRIQDLKSKVARTESDLPDVPLEHLRNLDKSAVKDALRRVVQWIAIGSEGVTVLTSWGTYMAATFREIEPGTYFNSKTIRGIHPPSIDSTLSCLGWFPSPKDFSKGRRHYLGDQGELLTDEEILPGYERVNVTSEAAELSEVDDSAN